MTGDVEPTGGHGRRDAAPRLVVWASCLVLLAATSMMLWGAWRTGISVDEPYHVLRLRNLFETGWYLLDDDFDGSVPGSWVADEYVYAPVATLLMHAVCLLLGIEGQGAVSASQDAYGVRHLVVAVLGLVGAFAVAATGRLLMRSWGWGLVAAGTLMAIPMWPGLSMFDIKDVPAATGYTLATLGLVLCLRRDRGRRWLPVGTITAIAAGAVLAVGTRPGLWTGLSLGVAVVLVSARQRDAGGRMTWAWWRLGELALGLVIAYAVLWAVYPAVFSRPDKWLVSSAVASSSYNDVMQGSWTYIPTRVSVTMPSLLLLLGCVGCLAAVLDWRGRRRGLREARIALVVLQALALPLLALLRQSHLYDDLRQLLFAAPAVALLLTLGTRHLVADLAKSGGSVAPRIVQGMWAAALVLPVVVQLQLFPYNYAYASAPFDLVNARTDNDFWRTSFRELLPEVPVDGFVVCSPFTTEQGDSKRYTSITGRPFALASTDCRHDPISPITPYLSGPEAYESRVATTFVGIFERGRAPGENCEALGQVTRQRYLTRQVMSTVARCELVLTPYPGSGWEFRLDGAGGEFLLGGWTSSPSSPEVRLWEPSGSLGFTLPEGWEDASLRVRLQGDAAQLPRMWVNNEPVETMLQGGDWVAHVPASTVTAMGERRLVITLAPATTGDELSLIGVHVDPL